jgi:hypothetical protein
MAYCSKRCQRSGLETPSLEGVPFCEARVRKHVSFPLIPFSAQGSNLPRAITAARAETRNARYPHHLRLQHCGKSAYMGFKALTDGTGVITEGSQQGGPFVLVLRDWSYKTVPLDQYLRGCKGRIRLDRVWLYLHRRYISREAHLLWTSRSHIRTQYDIQLGLVQLAA